MGKVDVLVRWQTIARSRSIIESSQLCIDFGYCDCVHGCQMQQVIDRRLLSSSGCLFIYLEMSVIPNEVYNKITIKSTESQYPGVTASVFINHDFVPW